LRTGNGVITMKQNAILSQVNSSDSVTQVFADKRYEITLKLSQEQISQILNYRLIQKMEQNNDCFDEYLLIAERIKSSQLSDKFCRFFSAELAPLVDNLIQENTDSYAITNFQHRMLRKFTDNES